MSTFGNQTFSEVILKPPPRIVEKKKEDLPKETTSASNSEGKADNSSENPNEQQNGNQTESESAVNNTDEAATKSNPENGEVVVYYTEDPLFQRIPQDIGKLIMKGRQAKGLSQKQLAAKVFERPRIIADYETGRGIANNTILGKIERVIGIKLKGPNIGDPLYPIKKN